MRFLGAGAGGVRGEAVVEMADDKKRVREADADGSEGMNVAVLTGDDNEEVAVAGVTLVSVSDEKTHEGDRDKVETKRARLQEGILVVQCSEEAVTSLETEVVEDKTLTTREVLIDDHHPSFRPHRNSQKMVGNRNASHKVFPLRILTSISEIFLQRQMSAEILYQLKLLMWSSCVPCICKQEKDTFFVNSLSVYCLKILKNQLNRNIVG